MDLESMNEEEIEAEALKQGYNPNYEGENKKSPKEFLEVAFNHNQVLKERNEKLSSEVEQTRAEVTKLRGDMEKVLSFAEEQKKKAVEKAVKELKEQRKEAIADSDHEKVEQIDEQIKEAEKAPPEPDPKFKEWVSTNQWYEDDPIMGAEADYYAKMFVESGRFKSQEQVFEAVTNKIKSLYPEKFKNPKKDDPPETEGGRPSPTKKSKKSYEDLPREAKQACDEFVEQGIMTREKYVSMYEWE